MINAVIFGLDGVICSTDEYHYRSWKAIADGEGIYFDRTINNQLRGISRTDSLDVILKRSEKIYTPEEKAVLADKKNAIYTSFLEKITPADCPDSVKETISWLKKQGIKVGLSSCSTNTKYILQKLQIENIFDTIVDGNEIKEVEPDPELFLLASEKLGIDINKTIVVEDSFPGIQAAKKGKYLAIGIGEGADYYQTDYPIENIREIIDIVTKLNQD
ncbi:MAG: beta-phosphoglucomutase [Bacilli bacterium]